MMNGYLRRLIEPANPNKIWRKISYGNIADIFMLDTRLYDRSLQGGNANDSMRHIVGNEQITMAKNGINEFYCQSGKY
jgi:phosphodiesterase/alkaline phosphatase D-like protein